MQKKSGLDVALDALARQKEVAERMRLWATELREMADRLDAEAYSLPPQEGG